MKVTSSVGLLLVLAAAAVLATGAGAFWNTRAVARATDWVAHTHEVQSALDQVLALMTDIEAAQRGYLLTADDRDLEPVQGGPTSWRGASWTVCKI